MEDLAILAKNIYNIDKTKVILSILGFIIVLIDKDNQQKYRGI